MRMIKQILFIILAISVSISTVQAQNSAEVLLDKVAEHIQTSKGITASFTLRGDSKNSLYMQGELKMQGKKFYLHTNDMTTWYDGKTMWSYARSINEVNITEPSKQELMGINPYYTLSCYKKAFAISELQAMHKGERRICLTPTDRTTTLSRIVITIITSTLSPVSFEITDTNNNVTYISVSDFNNKEKLPSQTFVFQSEKYPQADIIDLR